MPKTRAGRLPVTSSKCAHFHGASGRLIEAEGTHLQPRLSASLNGNAASEKCSKSRDIYLIVSSARARTTAAATTASSRLRGAKFGEFHLGPSWADALAPKHYILGRQVVKNVL